MVKRKTKKQANPNVRHIVHTVRLNADEMKTLLAKAHAYEHGDCSKLIRQAIEAYNPSKTTMVLKRKAGL